MNEFLDTFNYGLNFIGNPSIVEGFSDAKWNSNFLDMKSTS